MESPKPVPKFWGLHADPQGNFQRLLNILPFLILLGIYLTASHIRLTENPQDKLLPSPVQMWDALQLMAFTPDKRTGEYLMFTDTGSSLLRLGAGVGAAAISGLMLGLFTGLFRGLNALISPFLTFIAIIPPLSILPILFIVFGVDEFAKIMLIFIGTFPVITRDIFTATRAFPQELITFMNTRGKEKILFASDHPVLSMERTVNEAREMTNLKPGVLEKFLYDNAWKVLFEKRFGPATPQA